MPPTPQELEKQAYLEEQIEQLAVKNPGRSLTNRERELIEEAMLSIPQYWWGQRWIDSLLRQGKHRRMARGVKYFRQGRVQDAYIKSGMIFATVKGTDSRPYRVQFKFQKITENSWEKVYQGILQRPYVYMDLLENRISEDFQDIIKNSNVALFPSRKLESIAKCSCPDKEVPCKHIAAVSIYVASLLDIDPFQLFVLRGKSKQEFLSDLKNKKAQDMINQSKYLQKYSHFFNEEFEFDVPLLKVHNVRTNRTLNAKNNQLSGLFEIEALPPKNETLEQLGFPQGIRDPLGFMNVLNEIIHDASTLAHKLGKSIKNPEEESE